MSALGYIAATLLAMAYTTVLSGWALSLLWAWFIVPTFGAPALSIPLAAAMALVASYLTHQVDIKDDRPSPPFLRVLATMILWGTMKPLSALAFGLVLRGFM